MNSPLGDEGEYGVGGRSARDEATLDFLRARSGLRIELVGDLSEAASVKDGVRGGNSYVLSSFSNMDGVLGDTRSRSTTGVGRMPYLSACWLGRRHDSNSASSSGVTDRSVKPRVLFRVLAQKKRMTTVTAHKTSVPATTLRIM